MKEKLPSQLFIGTSNIILPATKANFPEPFRNQSRLHYYSSLFNSIEINSSFYKLPMHATFKKWSDDVAGDFRFTLKLSKSISHVKDLKFDTLHIQQFLQAASGIGEKKGILLLQFPGKISLAYYNELEHILETLHANEKSLQWQVAVEFRNPDWYEPETIELLNEFSATMVLHDHPKAKSVESTPVGDIVYLRMHGPEGNYRHAYSMSFLEKKARSIEQWIQEGKTVYCYFNNSLGDAFNNARQLQLLTNATPRTVAL